MARRRRRYAGNSLVCGVTHWPSLHRRHNAHLVAAKGRVAWPNSATRTRDYVTSFDKSNERNAAINRRERLQPLSVFNHDSPAVYFKYIFLIVYSNENLYLQSTCNQNYTYIYISWKFCVKFHIFFVSSNARSEFWC